LTARQSALGRRLFALALSVYLFSAGGSLTTTDAVVMFDVTRNLVEHRTVAMSGNLLGMEAHRGADGRYYSPFGLGQSLYNVPFYLAATIVTRATGLRIGKPDSLAKAFVALGQTFITAAIVWLVFDFACLVTLDLTASLVAALALAFASVLWPYSKFGFNQPLAALTLVAAVRSAYLGARSGESRLLVQSGFWIAASLMTRHEMAIAILPMAGWLWYDAPGATRERLRRLAAFAPGVLVGAIAWLSYNAVRFGNPFDSGYLRDVVPGFGSPFLSGLAGLLFSPAASILLYSPIAVGGVVALFTLRSTRWRSVAVLLGSLVGVFVVFYASLGNWLGGRSYGSRYLVVVLPLLAVAWAPAWSKWSPRARRAALALIVIGVMVQVPGVLVDYAKTGQAAAMQEATIGLDARQWEWTRSPLVVNARALAQALPDNMAYLTGRRPVPSIARTGNEADRSFSQQFSFSLDLWWLYLFYLGVFSSVEVALVAVAGVATVLWLSISLRRQSAVD
jgi:hypothetical protein